MLARVLEPEVMDSAEEARDYDAMDHREVNRVFVTDFLAFWNGQGLILDLGTGTGQIPIELCRRDPKIQVVALDMAEHMLYLARDNVSRAGLGERIQLERGDAKALPYAADTFGAIISNSIVHHIPEPRKVLAEMVRVVRPGGCLFVRDLLRPSDEATVQRLVGLYGAEVNAHQRQMFADSLRAALTLPEIRDLAARLHFDPAGVRQTSDRHWTWQAHKRKDEG
ncbi:MAG: class I SAM-dependent methyltransferase [Planctomycetes bacterium]|nr:class I SAM-dependent methyltransferase [Planctomycetota bacterium]